MRLLFSGPANIQSISEEAGRKPVLRMRNISLSPRQTVLPSFTHPGPTTIGRLSNRLRPMPRKNAGNFRLRCTAGNPKISCMMFQRSNPTTIQKTNIAGNIVPAANIIPQITNKLHATPTTHPSKLPGFDVLIFSGSTRPAGITTSLSCSSSELSAIVLGRPSSLRFHSQIPEPLMRSSQLNLNSFKRREVSHLGNPIGNNRFLKIESIINNTNGRIMRETMKYPLTLSKYTARKYEAIIAAINKKAIIIVNLPGRYKSMYCTFCLLNLVCQGTLRYQNRQSQRGER
jgi:hypothetical protein